MGYLVEQSAPLNLQSFMQEKRRGHHIVHSKKERSGEASMLRNITEVYRSLVAVM
jgi:hypothetical protein